MNNHRPPDLIHEAVTSLLDRGLKVTISYTYLPVIDALDDGGMYIDLQVEQASSNDELNLSLSHTICAQDILEDVPYNPDLTSEEIIARTVAGAILSLGEKMLRRLLSPEELGGPGPSHSDNEDEDTEGYERSWEQN